MSRLLVFTRQVFSVFCLVTVGSAAEIERIWLTHADTLPGSVVVSWETEQPGDSVVEFGEAGTLKKRVIKTESVTLHHVQIPLPKTGALHYRVRSGADASQVYPLRENPGNEFRVVIIGDAGYAKQPWGEAVLKEHPHLLLTAGDNVSALHQEGRAVAPDDTTAFGRFIDSCPELFRTTPLIPVLGNHDREFRPRGSKPPPEPVYDVEATAFRKFFVLPDGAWNWNFSVPEFGVCFAALDLSHLSDFGTTWQTCHPYQRESEQFSRYRDLVSANRDPFFITIYNEQNSRVRGLEGGEWGRMISQGSLAVTGFGYFGERAEVNGFTFYNTSVSGTGARYADPKSVVLESKDNFLLLTFRKDERQLTVEMKGLSGNVLDRKVFQPRF